MNAQVDPRDLTAHERRALAAIGQWKLCRAKGGWAVPGVHVTLAMAARLVQRGLVRLYRENGRPRLAVTGAGRNTLDVAAARRTSA